MIYTQLGTLFKATMKMFLQQRLPLERTSSELLSSLSESSTKNSYCKADFNLLDLDVIWMALQGRFGEWEEMREIYCNGEYINDRCRYPKPQALLYSYHLYRYPYPFYWSTLWTSHHSRVITVHNILLVSVVLSISMLLASLGVQNRDRQVSRDRPRCLS
jgi:hypothetical protein